MKNNLKAAVFQKIKEDKIVPIPESFFVCKQRILWIAIGVLLLFAMIFSGFLFDDTTEWFSIHGYGSGYGSYFLFPNIFWLLLIVFLVFMGIKKLRDTTVGHRSSYLKDVLIGVTVIIVGSIVLRGAGIGPNIHAFVATNIPIVSNILYNESSWNDPINGRLAGTIVEVGDKKVQLQSIDGAIWDISLENSLVSPKVGLQKSEKIRILGKQTSSSSFEATKIMPWFGMGTGNGRGSGQGRMKTVQ